MRLFTPSPPLALMEDVERERSRSASGEAARADEAREGERRRGVWKEDDGEAGAEKRDTREGRGGEEARCAAAQEVVVGED